MESNNLIKFTNFKVDKNGKIENILEDVQPFDEDNWVDGSIKKHIYCVATGRDYDIVGYVVAEDNDTAKQKAIELELVSPDMVRFLRVDKLLKKYHKSEHSKRKLEAAKSYSIYKYLVESFQELKKNK